MRDRYLNSQATDFFTDTLLLNILVDASREIAFAIRFPRGVITGTAAQDDTSIDLTSVQIDVDELYIGGLSVPKVPRDRITFLQALPAEPWPRGFYFDPRNSTGNDTLEIGPAVSPAAGVSYMAVVIEDPYSTTPDASTNAWDGRYPDHYEALLCRATERAYDMSQEYDLAMYWGQRYTSAMIEFAPYTRMAVPLPQQAATKP